MPWTKTDNPHVWRKKRLRAAKRRAAVAERKAPVAKKRKSTAIVRRRTVIVRKARRGARRVGAFASRNKVRIGTTVAAALYGYAKEKTQLLKSVPSIPQLGSELTWGIALHFIAKNTSGEVQKAADHGSTALLAIGAYNFGSKGFKLSGDDDLSGALDVDDADYE
jgi:hypothetical protein